jgi:hypothetical protein
MWRKSFDLGCVLQSMLNSFVCHKKSIDSTCNIWTEEALKDPKTRAVIFDWIQETNAIINHPFLADTRRVWRYQRGNQNPYIDEEQTTQWPKEKVKKDKQRSTKHTYKTKDRVTRTPLKIGGDLRCSGRVKSSCSTSGNLWKLTHGSLTVPCDFSWF